ncbi:MAG TPA: hypothetical protein VIU82_17190 [Bosea sp. (in: a-proteobacteria)]
MLLPTLALIATIGLTLWLAFSDSAIFALPLVVVIAGLVRHIIRLWTGRRYRVADLAHPSAKPES